MTTPDLATLLDRARAWAAEDPDDRTRAELEQLVADVEGGADATELADRFDGTLEFGTAGLRGALGAGPNRMNRVVVLRAAAGLAAYLKDQGAPRDSGVVIGYDARHNSDVFARDTAEVMTGAGTQGLRPAATAAHAVVRVHDPRAGLRRRRHGHREPQPAGGQRLQGLSRRRQPDRLAGGRRDRELHRRGRFALRHPPRKLRRAARRAPGGPLPRHRRGARRRRPARPEHRLHTAARRGRGHRHAGPGDRRLRRSQHGRRAGGSGPGLPDRRVPQPRGARSDGPGHGPGR